MCEEGIDKLIRCKQSSLHELMIAAIDPYGHTSVRLSLSSAILIPMNVNSGHSALSGGCLKALSCLLRMLNERDSSMSRVGLLLIRYGRCEDAGAQRLKLTPKIEPDTQICCRGKRRSLRCDQQRN
jgi:hypothetical protein